MQTITDNLEIRKPGGAFDGEAGATVRIIRDASKAEEGRPHLNPALYVCTITGKQQKAFEWAGYAQLDNYADAGENVGFYAKGNKFGAGPTWGGVSEVCDTEGKGDGAIVGQEVDCWATGRDTGNRIGLNVVVGDARQIRGLPGAGMAEATAGIQVNASSGTPWARWMYGAVLKAFNIAGLVIDGIAPRALWLKGSYRVGIDMSDAEVVTPLRFKAGQRITFEATDAIGMSFKDGRLVFDNNGVPKMDLDMTTGALRWGSMLP